MVVVGEGKGTNPKHPDAGGGSPKTLLFRRSFEDKENAAVQGSGESYGRDLHPIGTPGTIN